MRLHKNICVAGAKVLLTFFLFLFCIGVWPGYLVHTYKAENRFTTAILHSEPITSGECIVQYFVPTDKWLSKISIAIVWDEMALEEEFITFALLNEDGKLICEEEIPFRNIESGSFFQIPIGKKLKPENVYQWRLSMPVTAGVKCSVLYTEDVNGNAIENRELFINGLQSDGSALNQYEYYAHHDKVVIIGGYWAGALMVYLFLLELIQRLGAGTGRISYEDNTKNSE